MSSLKENPAPPKISAPSQGEKAAESAAVWEDARLVYPLYFFLATHFKLETPLTRQAGLPIACPTPDVFDCVVRWLDLIDTRIRTSQLRQLLHSVKDIKAENLRAVILRLLRRPIKNGTDRDNIDLLLATYFALCAPEDLYACEITLADVAQVLKGVLPDADATPLEWCLPLDQILEETQQCRGLRDLFAGKLLEKGRELKDAAGIMFYDPAALVAFTRFNFLLRRAFFRLLHADLRAIREGLSELERRGVTTVDCRSAGLTAQETVGHLREISLSWRQPIRSDYAAESANQTFEQLLAICSAVERAQGIASSNLNLPAIEANPAGKIPKPVPSAPREAAGQKPNRTGAKPQVEQARAPAEKATLGVSRNETKSVKVPTTIKKETPVASPAKTVKPAAPVSIGQTTATAQQRVSASGDQKGTLGTRQTAPNSNAPSLELEQCLESIWEQLIEAPPTRGRSMSTVSLGDARVLLSAWEVNAFVSDGGQLSDDLRRAVAARALIAVAREEQKRSGDLAKLTAALSQGRQEMAYLQERVEQAQNAKNTEAAVNLGITARRLLSAMEEAQSK
ncbi:MAG TPA: hypothetical protein VGT03_15350 [Candidatus Acidoferrales bacterium]|nr:hypothetical protein [Candidatus Acidoferrales bacterium]